MTIWTAKTEVVYDASSSDFFPFWAADPKGTMSYRTEG